MPPAVPYTVQTGIQKIIPKKKLTKGSLGTLLNISNNKKDSPLNSATYRLIKTHI